MAELLRLKSLFLSIFFANRGDNEKNFFGQHLSHRFLPRAFTSANNKRQFEHFSLSANNVQVFSCIL